MANDGNESLGLPSLYSFLATPEIKMRFAKLNGKLLRGRHIQANTDPVDYNLLNQFNYFDNFRFFYQQLYNLELHKRNFGGIEACFYLDFSDNGYNELTGPNKPIPLTPTQTKFGLMILNMFYEKFFERTKQVTWSEIEEIIMHSERQEDYKRVFFGSVRDNYSSSERGRLRSLFCQMTKRFDELGWISANNLEGDFNFIINVSIRRLEDMYKEELKNPDALFSQFDKQRNHKDITNDVS